MSCEQRYLVDEYLDGELGQDEAAAFEAHLGTCASCRSELEAVRALIKATGELPRELEPERDLWPQTAEQLRPVEKGGGKRRWILGGGALAVVGLLAALCAGVIGVGLLWPTDPSLEPARALLSEGDLPGALAAWTELSQDHPADAEVVEGAAYAALLAGDLDEADRLLSTLPDGPEVRLRRAMVAQRAGDLDAVAEHGRASGLPAGQVMAAEVHLADSEPDQARELLRAASAAGGSVGRTADTYLSLLDADDEGRALAEATALWSVGERALSCRAAEDLVVGLPDGLERDEQLMLWGSRCVTSRRPDEAEHLLDEVLVPPPGQQWRMHALRGMIHAARGEQTLALTTFEQLEQGGAPPQGVRDARATAASLTDDPEFAVALVGDQRSVAAARVLMEVGAVDAARRVVPEDTVLASVLGTP